MFFCSLYFNLSLTIHSTVKDTSDGNVSLSPKPATTTPDEFALNLSFINKNMAISFKCLVEVLLIGRFSNISFIKPSTFSMYSVNNCSVSTDFSEGIISKAFQSLYLDLIAFEVIFFISLNVIFSLSSISFFTASSMSFLIISNLFLTVSSKSCICSDLGIKNK